MKSLRQALDDYLRERRSAGRKMRAAGFALMRFVSFMEERDCGYITTALALEWANRASAAKCQERARAQCLGFVRTFAKYMAKKDRRTEIPPYALLPHPPRRMQPAEPVKSKSDSPFSASPEMAPGGRTLRQSIIEYLAMRRALGFKLKAAGKGLLNFASFMEQRGAEYVTLELAMEWAQQPDCAKPATWAQHLGFVRQFARHNVTVDARTEIPAWDLLPHSPKRTHPFLYSNADICKLLDATASLPVFNAAGMLRRRTYYCLIGLLAVSGMRISETVNLKLQEVDLVAGVLTICGSKFGKSRLIPIHDSTRCTLADYKAYRDEFLAVRDISSEYFFATCLGGKLDTADVRRKFYSLSQAAGLRREADSHGPRLHDFRHRFAVETLLRWHRGGEDVESKLPLLSTYLGHTKVKDTYWYLTACPELMEHAVRKLERRWEEAI